MSKQPLREEFHDRFTIIHTSFPSLEEDIADWWLSKFSERLQGIREKIQKEIWTTKAKPENLTGEYQNDMRYFNSGISKALHLLDDEIEK